MTWSMWLVLGLCLLAGEMLVPGGLFLLFFGLGALVVGLLSMIGLLGQAWTEWMIFALVSLGLLVLLRAKLKLIFGKGSVQDVDSYVGELAVVLEKLVAGGRGKVELRGSSWTALNVGVSDLEIGSRVRVQKVDGLTVHVVAE
jgi:membrane protein implicated in regulation of membrane protease activity